MSSLRFFLTAFVAAPLLLAGPSLAVAASGSTGPELPIGQSVPATHRPAPASHPRVALAAHRVQPAAPAPVAVAAAAASAAAPKVLSLSGIVVGANGKPCPGACVFPTTNTHLIAVTDAHGAFQLQVPAAASLNIQADYFGLGSSRIAVDGQHPQPVIIAIGR